MPILLVIVCGVLIVGAAGLGVYWGVVLWHIARTVRRVPMASDGLKTASAAALAGGDAPRVCVVVPAHNEAGVVGRLATSLMQQTYPKDRLSVVFCLDRCTDATATEIRHATGGADHIRIVEITSCPEGWAGKVNAVRVGVRETPEARAADLLLFTDADTEFDPECVRATVALLKERGLGMLSLLSTLTSDAWFERVVQPAAGMELARQYPLERANTGEAEVQESRRAGEQESGETRKRRPFANGQFMLFTRDAYEQVGGHEAARGAVLEDIELARLVERANIAAGLMLADGMVRCTMYADYPEFIRGWKRIYVEAANRRVQRLRDIGMRVRVLGCVLPGVAAGAVAMGVWQRGDVLGLATLVVGGAGLGLWMAALAWSYRLSRVPMWCVLGYPVGAWCVGGILREAARELKAGVPVKWAGKEYVREAR